MEAIVTHKNTDFDALASLVAASLLYPSAIPLLPKALNINVKRFLSIHKDHFTFRNEEDVDPGRITRLIVVDASDWNRIEGLDGLVERGNLEIHLWDHHQGGDIRGTWSNKRPVGAATTLLVNELRKQKKDFSPIEATLFTAGIYEDTGNMTFPSTTAEDAKATAFLLEQGADLNLIKSILRPVYGPRQKDILSAMLQNEKQVGLNGYVVSFNRVPIEGHTPGLALVVDMYHEITNVDASFGVFEDSKRNHTILIARSSEETLDIGAVMRQMGGGGHPSAGSAMLKGVPPETIEKRCMELMAAPNPTSVKITDLMSYPVLTVSPGMAMWEAAMLFREKGCTGLPVCDGENLLGVITRRDFRKKRTPPRLDRPVKAYMTSKVIWITPETSVDRAIGLLVKHDIGRLPVLDGKKLIGIVTRSDVMRYYYDMLPL